jgi:hypothetical protein
VKSILGVILQMKKTTNPISSQIISFLEEVIIGRTTKNLSAEEIKMEKIKQEKEEDLKAIKTPSKIKISTETERNTGPTH